MSYSDEMAIEAEVYFAIAEANFKKQMWTQRDGKQISVDKMSSRHIRNTIAMLERGNSYLADEWIATFRDELEKRGE